MFFAFIGYMGEGFYRSKDPTNSIKVLKEKAAKENNTKDIKKTENTHTQNTQWAIKNVPLNFCQ